MCASRCPSVDARQTAQSRWRELNRKRRAKLSNETNPFHGRANLAMVEKVRSTYCMHCRPK
jgi:hypothetical protein